MKRGLAAIAFAVSALAASRAPAQDIVRSDHRVVARSIAPGLRGQDVDLFVREVAPAAGPARGVVLFVHGAGTPAEASFDLPYGDYSWMAYLARAGFDTFALDLTGYGRSTHPPGMDDPCNMPKAEQAEFAAQIHGACGPAPTGSLTTMASDWADIAAVVDHVLAMRHVRTLALIGWSQGGARTAGYALRHPDKVSRLVVLAPDYNRGGPLNAPSSSSMRDGLYTVMSEAKFRFYKARQTGCPGQIDPAVNDAVWAEQMAADPVGAAWTPPARRAPSVPTYGFNKEVAAKLKVPYLMIAGAYDRSVDPKYVRELYEDLASPEKVFVDLACSSHNAMWEKNHLLLFKASADWLTTGKVEGVSKGMIRLGY